MRIMLKIVIFQLFCVVAQKGVIAGNAEADHENLTDWVKDQHTSFKNLLIEWRKQVIAELRPMLQELESKSRSSGCSDTGEGLNALLQKLNVEVKILEEERERSSKHAGNFNSSEALSKLGQIKVRSKFLADESGSETPSECIRKFRRKHGELMQQITYVEAQLKVDVRLLEVQEVIENMKRKRLGPIIDLLSTMEAHDLDLWLNEVVEKMFPERASLDKDFTYVLWLLGTLETQTPYLTSTLTELMLDKLKGFSLLQQPYLMQLAYTARINQASLELVQRFPLQIQNLFWGKVNCIKNPYGSSFLREEYFPEPELDVSGEQLTALEVGGYFESSIDEIIPESCGWEIEPVGGTNNGEILFKVTRKVSDPERIWILSRNDTSHILINSDPADQNTFWEILPSMKIGKDMDAISLQILTPASVNTEIGRILCHKPIDRQSLVDFYGVYLTEREDGNKCEWVLEKID